MVAPVPDQRGTRRFALNLPVAVRFRNAALPEMQAFTKDVSARGVYLYMDVPVEAGSKLDFTMILPPEITLTDQIRVRCVGHVLRVESNVAGKIGVAALIENYEFLPEA